MQKFKINPAQLFVLEDEQGNKILTVKDGDSYVALRLSEMPLAARPGISLARRSQKTPGSDEPHRSVPSFPSGEDVKQSRPLSSPLVVIPEFSFRPRMTPALPFFVGGMKISGIPQR